MLLLRLYPGAWRERYEAEMLALLEQHHVTLATRVDLLRGACDAWLDQRRAILGSIRQGALIGAVPSAFILAQFLLGLDLHIDAGLYNFTGFASLVGLGLACLWAGERRAAGRSAWTLRLLAGAAAGAAGVMANAGMENGLHLLDDGVGISSFAWHLEAGGDWGTGHPIGPALAELSDPRMLLPLLWVTLIAVPVGAVIAALGTPLHHLLPRRAESPQPRPPSSTCSASSFPGHGGDV